MCAAVRNHFNLASDARLRIEVSLPEYDDGRREIYAESWSVLKPGIKQIWARDFEEIYVILRNGMSIHRIWVHPEKTVREAANLFLLTFGFSMRRLKKAYLVDVILSLSGSFSSQNVPSDSIIDLEIE